MPESDRNKLLAILIEIADSKHLEAITNINNSNRHLKFLGKPMYYVTKTLYGHLVKFVQCIFSIIGK